MFGSVWSSRGPMACVCIPSAPVLQGPRTRRAFGEIGVGQPLMKSRWQSMPPRPKSLPLLVPPFDGLLLQVRTDPGLRPAGIFRRQLIRNCNPQAAGVVPIAAGQGPSVRTKRAAGDIRMAFQDVSGMARGTQPPVGCESLWNPDHVLIPLMH